MTKSIRIALIEADSRRRAALSHSLAPHDVTVAPFESLEELRANWPTVDLVLACDDAADGGDIADLMKGMLDTGVWTPVVAYAEQPELPRVVSAVQTGAVDYVAWPFAADALIATLRKAIAHAAALAGGKLREAAARKRITLLSPREREVLGGVASGYSSREIGKTLGISPRTVEIHRANMLVKLGVGHTCEAIRMAVEGGMFDDDGAEWQKFA